MRQPVLVQGCALSIGLLLTVAAHAGTPTPIASGSVENPQSLWRQVMTHFYGAYDDLKRCWIGDDGPARYCMRPHQLETITIGDVRTSFLVTAGYMMTATGGRDNCHACQGTIGMIVLADDGPNQALLARNSLYEPYGAWGKVPSSDDFTFQKLGHKDRYGWLIRSGWTGQGITQSWVTIYGTVDAVMKNLGDIPLSYDETGNCDGGKHLDTGRPCTDYYYELRLDTNDWRSDFYGIELHLAGSRQGNELDQTYRVVFDHEAGRYKLPAGLPNDG